MADVGAYEAKVHFSQLLERVGKGECITITKHGRPIAALTPVEDAPGMRRDPAIRALRSWKKGWVTRPDMTVEALVDKEHRT